jgi:hypothetical protein
MTFDEFCEAKDVIPWSERAFARMCWDAGAAAERAKIHDLPVPPTDYGMIAASRAARGRGDAGVPIGDLVARDNRPADTWASDWCMIAGALLAGFAFGRQPFVDRWDGWLIAAGVAGVLFAGLAFRLAGRGKG